MKTFKQFIFESTHGYNYVFSEGLNDSQKKIVDSWQSDNKSREEGSPNAVAISSHVIPRGQHKVTIPLGHETEPENVKPHPEVENHLKAHGYSISDYKGGYATDKYGRQTSIGKILNKTKATKEVTNAFNTDPNRKGSTQASKGLSVTISRHPHHIAGMSTNQGWTSCMDMEGGCYRGHLKDDVAQGTHVAYLHHANDTELNSPIARIALKPFHSEEGGHTILRPESQSYGDSDSSFAKTVNNWAEKNFPFKKGQLYNKDSRVYHDSGSNVEGDIDARLKHHDPVVRAAAVSHPKATTEHITKAQSDDEPYVRAAADHVLQQRLKLH